MYIAAHFCRHFLGACQVSSAKLLPLLKMIVGCSNLEVLLSTPGQRTNSWKAHYAFLGKVSKSVCEKCSFLYRGQVQFFHRDRHYKGSFYGPSISIHSKPCTMPHTRLLEYFALQHCLIKTKHLRSLVQGFE